MICNVFANSNNKNYLRGIKHKNAGQYQKAIASFNTVLKSVKTDIDHNLLAETHFQIASTYHILAEYDKSIASYKKAI